MRFSRWILLSAISSPLAACGGSSAAPAGPPSATGTWTGTVGQPMSGTALRLTWQAAQTGANVTGPATLVKPATNIPANGALEGSLSGTLLTLRFTVAGGTISGFPNCAVSATGTATLSSTAITGTLITSFSSCAGTGLEPPGSNQLTLTRQ